MVSPNEINLEEQEGVMDFSFLDRYTEEQRKAVATLNLNSTGITSLKGIEHLPNLQEIDLGGTEVEDLSPLQNFAASLISLRLTNVVIKQDQLQTISQLTGLQALYIDNSSGEGELTDTRPLAQLVGLKTLSIAGNPDIENLNNMANCTQLEELDISNTKIKNLEKIGALKSLTAKDIDGLSASALSSLNQLVNLKELYVDDNLKNSATAILESMKKKNNQVELV